MESSRRKAQKRFSPASVQITILFGPSGEGFSGRQARRSQGHELINPKSKKA